MKPRPLQPGGTIGVAAPSSPFEKRSEIDRGVRWWEQRGYRVKLAPHVQDRDDYVAGDARSRAHDLSELFVDPEVDVIQMLRGGYGASQIVPHLDWDAIEANPKALVGCSDVTALHVAIRQRTGLLGFYGPGLTGMGSAKRGEWSKERVLRALTDAEPLGEVPARPDDPYIGAYNSGRATAPLVGGCLWLLRETIGTPWEVDLDGCILFIEDVFEAHLVPLGVPIVHNLPLGHGEHLCTIPLGVTATVDADARTLTIDEPALEALADRSAEGRTLEPAKRV